MPGGQGGSWGDVGFVGTIDVGEYVGTVVAYDEKRLMMGYCHMGVNKRDLEGKDLSMSCR